MLDNLLAALHMSQKRQLGCVAFWLQVCVPLWAAYGRRRLHAAVLHSNMY